jgi:hypothetical protein
MRYVLAASAAQASPWPHVVIVAMTLAFIAFLAWVLLR